MSLVEDLKRSGYKVNLDAKSQAVQWNEVKFDRTVPEYRHKVKGRSSYGEEIAAKIAADQQTQEDVESQIWQQRTGEEPKRGPGRSPGSKNKPTIAEMIEDTDEPAA